MRSPTTWKRKWPDSITPAWIGPTATWYASSPRTGTVQCGELEVVVDERPERLVAVEADAVEVVRLPLVPARGGREVDDRRRRSSLGADRLERIAPSGATSTACTADPPLRCVQAGEARGRSRAPTATASR